MKNKKIIKIVIGVMAVFIIFNIFWYIWRNVRYGSYDEGFNKNELWTFIVPRYYLIDEEGYDYTVKYPEYLSFTGNLTAGMPTTDNNPFTDFLVIWPKPFGGYEYGISLTVDGTNYQIMIDEDGKSIDPQFDEITERCKETIDILLGKADKIWNLRQNIR